MARQDTLLAQAHAALLQLRPEGKGRGAWAAKRPAAHKNTEAGGVTASSNAAVGKPHAITVKCEGEAVAAEGARAGSPSQGEAPGRQAAVAAEIKEGAWGRSPGPGERRDLREAVSPRAAAAEAGGVVQSPGFGERQDLREEARSLRAASAEAGGKVQSPGSEERRDLREALRAAREELRASRVRVAVLEAEAVHSQAGAVHIPTRAAGMLRSSGGGGGTTTASGKRQHSKDDTDDDASLQRDQQQQGEADADACGGGGHYEEDDVLQALRDRLASAEAELDELRQQLRLQGMAVAAVQAGSAGDDDGASAGAAAGGGGGSGGGIVRGWGGPGVSVVWVFQQLVKHVEELGNYQLPLAR